MHHWYSQLKSCNTSFTGQWRLVNCAEYTPDAVICARVSRNNDVASTCRCPHSLSPTTLMPVATLYLACKESRTLCVYLNFSTCVTPQNSSRHRSATRFSLISKYKFFSYSPCSFIQHAIITTQNGGSTKHSFWMTSWSHYDLNYSYRYFSSVQRGHLSLATLIAKTIMNTSTILRSMSDARLLSMTGVGRRRHLMTNMHSLKRLFIT